MSISAMNQALEALESKYIVNCGAWRLQQDEAITALRQAIAEAEKIVPSDYPNSHQQEPEVPCKTHPDAPHGFDRNASHSADRYVCECEGWEPEPVAGYSDIVSDGGLDPRNPAPVHARPVVHAVRCTYPQCQATNGCVGACSKEQFKGKE